MKRKAKRNKPETVSVGNVTVKIYTRTRATITGDTRTIYEVSDYTSGIRRLRGFTEHAEARREADRIARQLSTGQAEAATMTNREAAVFGRGVELLRPTGLSLDAAAAVVAEAVAILGGNKIIAAANFYRQHCADQITRKTVAEVVAELIATREARGASVRYIGDLRARLGRFAETFAVDISSVTTADVQRWLDGLDVSPQTAKNFRTVLSTLFSFAESRGYIFKGGNPVESTEKISANGEGEIEIFTPEEIGKLLHAASKHAADFLPVLALGAFAGMRTMEIQRLEWSNIDLAGGFIHIGADNSKTRSRRLVPILPNLARWLAPYARRKGQVFNGTPDDLREARAETVKASGVPWKANALRHSFISYRLADIQNAAQVALEAGNSPAVVFKHYRELVKPSAVKAWFAVAPEAAANVVQLKTA